MTEMGRGKKERQTDRETERQRDRERQRQRDRDNLGDTTAKLNLYSMSFVNNNKTCELSCSIGEHWTVC